jgi:microcystin-dependent protein
MAEPFLGEIRMMSFNFPPKGWAVCAGQLLPINQNQALFSLLGTMYGGDGRVNFALPNLVGRVPIHRSSTFTQGQAGGETSHTITMAEMPAHTHVVNADSGGPIAGSGNQPGANRLLSGSNPGQLWANFTNPTPMNPGVIGDVGGSQPHNNMQPFATTGFCIALIGIFPSRN